VATLSENSVLAAQSFTYLAATKGNHFLSCSFRFLPQRVTEGLYLPFKESVLPQSRNLLGVEFWLYGCTLRLVAEASFNCRFGFGGLESHRQLWSRSLLVCFIQLHRIIPICCGTQRKKLLAAYLQFTVVK